MEIPPFPAINSLANLIGSAMRARAVGLVVAVELVVAVGLVVVVGSGSARLGVVTDATDAMISTGADITMVEERG